MSSRIQHALESCYGGLYAAYNGIVSAMASPSLHDSSEDALIDLLSENHLEKNEENQIDLDQLNRINEMFRSNAKVGEGGRSLDEIRGVMDRSFMWYRQDCTDHYLFYLAYKEVGDPCEGYRYRIIEICPQFRSLGVTRSLRLFYKNTVSVEVPPDRYEMYQQGYKYHTSYEFNDFIKQKVLKNSKYEFFFPKDQLVEGSLTKRAEKKEI